MHTCTSTKGKEWTHSCFYLKTGKTDVNYAQIHEHFHIKGIFLFYSHWYSAASTEKKTSVEVRCVCSLHVWVSTWMRLAAGFLLFSKCFCRCCSCTFRAKPEPRMPYVEKTKTHIEFKLEENSPWRKKAPALICVICTDYFEEIQKV